MKEIFSWTSIFFSWIMHILKYLKIKYIFREMCFFLYSHWLVPISSEQKLFTRLIPSGYTYISFFVIYHFEPKRICFQLVSFTHSKKSFSNYLCNKSDIWYFIETSDNFSHQYIFWCSITLFPEAFRKNAWTFFFVY